MVDDKLNWQVHLNYTKNKMTSGLYALNKLEHVLNQSFTDPMLFYITSLSQLWFSPMGLRTTEIYSYHRNNAKSGHA